MSHELSKPGFIEGTRKWCREHRLAAWWESFYPAIGAGLMAIVTLRVDISDDIYKALLDNVLNTAISVASVLAGFQATGQAVLLAILDTKAVAFLRETNHYDRIVRFLWRSIFTLLLFVIVALVVLAMHAGGELNLVPNRVVIAGLVFLLTYALLSSYRITKLMFKALVQKHNERAQNP